MKNSIAGKVLLWSCIMIIVLNLGGGYFISKQAYDNVVSVYTEDIENTIKTISANLDIEALKSVIESGDMESEAFNKVHDYLNHIKNRSDIKYIYTLMYKDGKPYYLVDGDDLENDTFGSYGDAFDDEGSGEEYKENPERLSNGKYITYDFEKDEKWGIIYIIEGPILEDNGNLVGSIVVDVDANKICEKGSIYRRNTYIAVVTLAAIQLVLVYLIINGILGRAFKGLGHIVDATTQFDFSDSHLGEHLALRKDEIGEITSKVMTMRTKLRYQAEKVKEAANKVDQTIVQVDTKLTQSNQATQEISRSIEELAEGVNEQVIQTNTSYEMLSLLSKRIEELNERIKRIDTIILEAKQGEGHSKERMNQLDSSVESNHSLSKSVENNMQALAERSKKIEGVVEVISNITRQTSLLALNAAIEAARAGDVGKGFGVVSDEIKGLSEDTYNSTEEIKTIVLEIIQDIQNTSTAIDSLITSNHEVGKDSEEVSKVFDQTIQHIDHVARLANEIRSFTSQINDYKEKVNETTKSLTDQAQRYSAIAEEITATTEVETENSRKVIELADELKETVVNLNEVIGEYKL